MRLLITADLHYDHGRSPDEAVALIGRMNAAGGDAVLLAGDTAARPGALREALGRFTIAGPRLVIAGNHELWTLGGSSLDAFRVDLPALARGAGWQWLEAEPFVAPGRSFAIVGTIGWYDYSFAAADLGIPRRFYAAKVSPGAADRLGGEYGHLLEPADDIPAASRGVVARWNDGRYVNLGMSDEAFLDELLAKLEAQLSAVRDVPHVLAAVHVLPFRELLPPPRSAQWDFVKAFLGSERIGRLLLDYANVRRVVCGHSHFPAEAAVGQVRATNVGSGYRGKRFLTIDLPD